MRALFLLLALVWSLNPVWAQEAPKAPPTRAYRAFLGPIPLQWVSPGSETTLDLRRFYQPGERAEVRVPKADPACEVVFDRERMLLRLRPAANAKGLLKIPFVAAGDGGRELTGTLALAVRPRAEHRFVFRPAAGAKPQKAAVVGSFNGWNKGSHLLERQADGSFARTVPLEPGSVLYKFFVDGQWVGDASNPRQTPDGFGGSNSVLDIPTPDDRELLAAVAAWERSRDLAASTRDGSFDYRDAVMYFALTDRFANGSRENDAPTDDANVLPPANWQGGDWKGLTQKIEEGYFEKLGVNVLWLGPLNRNPAEAYREYPAPNRWYTGYHGYWPISPTEVDPHYGTAADLKALVAAAHRRGMKVLADLVLHHVHEQHPFWRDHRDWFGKLELPDGRKNLRLWDEHQYTTWFEPYLPSFNFDHPGATEAMIENSIWWLQEFDLDGFRLDAVKHIPTSFWWKFRAALRDRVELPKGRKLYLVGETFMDRAGISSFVGPNMLDGQFDFPLYDTIVDVFARESAGLDALERSLRASEATYGAGHLMSPLIGNHDKSRFMAYADGDLPDPKIEKEEEVGWAKPPRVDRPESFAKLALAQAFLMSIDGVLMLYYGDEYGETGAGDPDNRRRMRFGAELSAAEQSALERMQFYGQFRARHPALRRGTRRTLAAERNFLAFVRTEGNDRVLCLFHRGPEPATHELVVKPELPDGDYIFQPQGTKVTVKDGRVSITLAAREAAFLEPQREARK
ncbi:MAG: hypothetical protein JSR82_08850 [Verrucomicrobia bacterium]|nr:hypothetical protein [Verrucomicrobiota bacterium]